MNSGLFWLIVLPMLVAAIAIYLVILVIGLFTAGAALKTSRPKLKIALATLALIIIASPVLYHLGMDARANQQADARAARIDSIPRVDIAGRMPATFIAVGSFPPDMTEFVQTKYGLRPLPAAKNDRLVSAYINYRKAELCHRRFGDQTVAGTKLAACKPLHGSIQQALSLKAPLLVFAEGRHTSLREDNVIAGKIYEIRLITPQEDGLVAYFEERTIKGTPSIFMPYTPPRRKASTERPPHIKTFIEEALISEARS